LWISALSVEELLIRASFVEKLIERSLIFEKIVHEKIIELINVHFRVSLVEQVKRRTVTLAHEELIRDVISGRIRGVWVSGVVGRIIHKGRNLIRRVGWYGTFVIVQYQVL
jgi:hypothetical protein